MSQNRTGVDAAVGNWPDVLDVAVAECVQVVRAGSGSDWSVRAGRLDWTCRATALHIASDLVGYTGRLTAPRERGYVPFEVVFEEEPDAEGMAEAIRSTGGLLSAAARTAAPGVLSWHPFGMAGPVDLCAMGVVEGLVHAHDIAEGLGMQWQAPVRSRPDPSSTCSGRRVSRAMPGASCWWPRDACRAPTASTRRPGAGTTRACDCSAPSRPPGPRFPRLTMHEGP